MKNNKTKNIQFNYIFCFCKFLCQKYFRLYFITNNQIFYLIIIYQFLSVSASLFNQIFNSFMKMKEVSFWLLYRIKRHSGLFNRDHEILRCEILSQNINFTRFTKNEMKLFHSSDQLKILYQIKRKKLLI